MRFSRSSFEPLLAVPAWAALCLAGFSALWIHQLRPGPSAAAPARWPDGAPPREDGRPALVMLIHPRCPCTGAALAELAAMLPRVPAGAVVDLIFVRPRGEPPGWERDSPSWRTASAMAGARVLVDGDGSLAARFGALVSGQVLVYDARGGLAFSGGITSARGHRGANDGRDAALAALQGFAARPSWPVFGCAL